MTMKSTSCLADQYYNNNEKVFATIMALHYRCENSEIAFVHERSNEISSVHHKHDFILKHGLI